MEMRRRSGEKTDGALPACWLDPALGLDLGQKLLGVGVDPDQCRLAPDDGEITGYQRLKDFQTIAQALAQA